jgi:predicted CoA-binding protein
MPSINLKVDRFLTLERIAVAGVSLSGENTANIIYHKMKKSCKTVIAVNPKGGTLGDDHCYPDLQSIPGGVDGVVIVTRPETTEKIVRDCAGAAVRMVWMHRSLDFFGGGSVSEDAVAFCHQNGIEVIAGACPMMFCQPVDIAHRCMGWMMRVSGRMPS